MKISLAAPIVTGAMPAYTPATTAGIPMTSSAAASAPIVTTGGYSMPMSYGGYTMPSALDHSQGKWFAPGEMLPPGYVVTAHPEGHVAPQEGHLMSDQARESFVITTGAKTGASAPKAKKSKKKKSSGCC
mmetsp:Transcript_5037/g.5645  ORF Transcript_5037/g.5645 Transcript_5037/m.5645 type:complete len:130 (-) Transcript_5037:8-397(-)